MSDRGIAGQSLADYAIGIAVIALVAVVALMLLGGETSAVLNNVSGGV